MPLIRVLRHNDSVTLTQGGRVVAKIVLTKTTSTSARLVLVMPPETIAQHDAARPQLDRQRMSGRDR